MSGSSWSPSPSSRGRIVPRVCTGEAATDGTYSPPNVRTDLSVRTETDATNKSLMLEHHPVYQPGVYPFHNAQRTAKTFTMCSKHGAVYNAAIEACQHRDASRVATHPLFG
eukprot:7690511-Lingulodinium_polyedra.AAC.1